MRVGRQAHPGAANDKAHPTADHSSASATPGVRDGLALSPLTNPTTGFDNPTTLRGPVPSQRVRNLGDGPPAPAAPAETTSAGNGQHHPSFAAPGHPMTLPSSPTARQSIIREMMAFAVAPSTRAVGSLPAPRLNPARCLDTGTATAADAQAPAEPLTAESLASAPLGDGGQVEEQGAGGALAEAGAARGSPGEAAVSPQPAGAGTHPDLRRREKIATGGFSLLSASGGPRRAPGPSKNDSG